LDLSKNKVIPYRALGLIYDEVMDHVDYDGWAEFVIEILRDYNRESQILPEPTRIIECGCGTGSLAIRLALSGYRLTAFDKSAEMIDQAKLKAAGLREPPIFEVGEFSTLSSMDSYDACLCLYDSVNYLMDELALRDYFTRVHDLLVADGLLIFDICTEYNSISYFDKSSDENFGKGHHYTRAMTYDKDNQIQQNVFIIWFKSEPKKQYVEIHRQKIYSESTVRSIVESSGFKVLEVVDGFYRNKVRDDTLRIHFICSKE